MFTVEKFICRENKSLHSEKVVMSEVEKVTCRKVEKFTWRK